MTGSGPSATNSLGKAFFETVTSPLAGPIAVGADGSIASGTASNTALYHLRVRQTAADKERSAHDSMAYSVSTGLTTILDQVLPPSPGPINPGQSLSGLDHFRMYDPYLAIHRRNEMLLRLQTNFLHNQNDINLPELKERLKNQFQLFGDDMFMTGGIGEWGAPVPASTTAASFAAWTEAQRLIAQAALAERERRQRASARSQTVIAGLRGGRRGVRDQGPALARPARRRRDPRAARTAEGPRRRHLHVRPPLDGHGQRGVPDDRRQRHPARAAPGRRPHRAAEPLVRALLRHHRAELRRPADQPRPVDHPRRGAARDRPVAPPGT